MSYDPRACGAKCDECPLYVQGAKPVPPKWGRTPSRPIVLVADGPGAQEVKRGELFVGAAGVKLDEMLWESGIKRSGVMLATSALLCRAEVPQAEGRKRYDLKNWIAWWRKENAARRRAAKDFAKAYPGTTLAESVREMASPFDCCYPRLQNELAQAEGVAQGANLVLVVMPMGSFALGAVSGKPGKPMSIMKYRGSVITEEYLQGVK